MPSLTFVKKNQKRLCVEGERNAVQRYRVAVAKDENEKGEETFTLPSQFVWETLLDVVEGGPYQAKIVDDVDLNIVALRHPDGRTALLPVLVRNSRVSLRCSYGSATLYDSQDLKKGATIYFSPFASSPDVEARVHSFYELPSFLIPMFGEVEGKDDEMIFHANHYADDTFLFDDDSDSDDLDSESESESESESDSDSDSE